MYMNGFKITDLIPIDPAIKTFDKEGPVLVFSPLAFFSNNRKLFPYMPKIIALMGPYEMNGRESPRKNPVN
jgi:hypothetical protein